MKAALVPRLCLLALLCGCRTAPTLPPVDLQSPGWTVRQGQAIWTAKRGGDGVAGELLLATQANGACFVQFSKPPFTLATARAAGGDWSIELQSAHRAFGGKGNPPTQFVWFALVNALHSHQPEAMWRFASRGAGGWRLANTRTGESLEGFLSP